MLSDFDWADRMAIPVTFIQAAGQPTAAAFMQTLVNWRIGGINRDTWLRKVAIGTGHPVAFGDRRPVATMQNEAAFYNALRHKCINLYGGTGTDADPLALARHPWTLTAQEFADTYDNLTKEKLPDLPDDRARYGAMATLYGGVPGIAGVILGVASAPVTGAVIAVGSLGLGMAAAGSDHEKENAQARQRAQLRGNFAGYVEIYQREASYRRKEVSV